MDKTGTITTGKPEVLDILPIGAPDENDLLRVAGALEMQSTHPIAKAITRTLKARGIEFDKAQDMKALTGIGIEARLDGKHVKIGGPRMLDESDPDGSEEARRHVEQLESNSRTVMVVIADDSVLGVIGLADRPRSDAVHMVKRLRALGVRLIVMLTGDNERVANSVAEEVGIDLVRANLMPEDKIRIVNELCAKNQSVAMVGDGVNDAPAMAASTVGIAMGAGGTDVALETADIALMASDLSKLPFAIGLSRRVRRTITQNFVISLAVIAGLVPVAALGYAPIWIAVIFHEGSTLVVVLNALRLLGYRDRTA